MKVHNHLKVEFVRGQAGMVHVSTPASLRKKEEAGSLIITRPQQVFFEKKKLDGKSLFLGANFAVLAMTKSSRSSIQQ